MNIPPKLPQMCENTIENIPLMFGKLPLATSLTNSTYQLSSLQEEKEKNTFIVA